MAPHPTHHNNEPATFNHEFEFTNKLQALEAVTDLIPAVIIIHKLSTMEVVWMSPNGLNRLGVTVAELNRLGAEYHSRYFNPEDAADYVPRITSLLQDDAVPDGFVTYFQQVRPGAAQDWSWYLSSSQVFLRNPEGKPLYLISYATPIDPEHHITSKLSRLLEEKNFRRRYQDVYNSLTRREREILQHTALGTPASELAASLHISEKTVITHKRNIRSKIQAQSPYDVTRFAQAFDLI